MFAIRVVDEGRIELEGRLDAAQAGKARAVLAEVERSAVLDLAALEYISSAGLGVLFAAQKRLMGTGAGLRLVNLDPHVREVFQIAGFDAVFEID